MPNRAFKGLPIDLVRSGTWPDARLRGPKDAVRAAEVLQTVARRLRDEQVRRGLSQRGLSKVIGTDNAVTNRLATGRSWGDLTTILRAEQALDRRLLPDWRERRAGG